LAITLIRYPTREFEMKLFSCTGLVSVLLMSAPLSAATQKAVRPDLSRIGDVKSWNLINADADAAVEQGKAVVRLKPQGPVAIASNIGLATVAGLEFGEGTLEIDLKGKGKQQRSFVGVAFNVADGRTFEAVYFRPFNFVKKDKTFRDRAVQYVSWPDHPWERLRSEHPRVFESAIKPVPDPAGWFHARVEVKKHKVSVWVDNSKEPCLIVDRLTGREKGKVGLWVDSHEAWFSNLTIRPANP